MIGYGLDFGWGFGYTLVIFFYYENKCLFYILFKKDVNLKFQFALNLGRCLLFRHVFICNTLPSQLLCIHEEMD